MQRDNLFYNTHYVKYKTMASVGLQDLPALKKAYNKAVEDKANTFIFKDTELLVPYAKYLIKYLESVKKDLNI